MVICLDRTLDSLLREIESRESIVEEVSIREGLQYDSFCLQRMYSEFTQRFPREIRVLEEQNPELWSAVHADNEEIVYDLWRLQFGRVIREAVQNAWRHGNKLDRNKNVIMTKNYGTKGVLYVVTDEGEGFDVRTIVDKFRRSDDTYHHWISNGIGFQFFDQTDMVVSFSLKGNETYLKYTCKSLSQNR